jgi:hypothetical protein
MKKTNYELAESVLSHLIFDALMTQVMYIKDYKRRNMLKKTFSEFEKAGKRLWKYQIKELQEAGIEADFDEMAIQLYDVIRQFAASKDRKGLINVMKKFNFKQ